MKNNQKQNIKSIPNEQENISTQRKKMPTWKIVLYTFLILIILGATVIGGAILMYEHQTKEYASTLGQNLSVISNNTPEVNNKKFNGKYTMIFYRHNCPHCQKVIPRVYAKNKTENFIYSMTFHHTKSIQYRDVLNPNNYELSDNAKVNYVPTEVKIQARHGKIVHVHKLAKVE